MIRPSDILTSLSHDCCECVVLIPVDSLDILDLKLIDDLPSTDVIKEQRFVTIDEDLTKWGRVDHVDFTSSSLIDLDLFQVAAIEIADCQILILI